MNIAESINHYLSSGMPPSKLILGLATYGRSWTMTTAGGGLLSPAPNPGKEGTCTRE